jgi:hypothetical protein
MALTYATVTTAAQLAQDITDLSGQTGSFTITIGANFTFDRQIGPLAMGAGGSLSIVGGGHTLSGANTYQGLFVATGTVAIDSLTLANMKAQGVAGGAGFYGGGGGMGAGGALFVGSGGNVALTNVSFSGNTAIGGKGGNYTPSGNGSGGRLSGSGSLGSYGAGAFGGGGNGYSNGGFGGGAGGTFLRTSRSGGFGAGNSSGYAGGGGLGAGGAVFVRQGGVLSFGAGTISGGAVGGGAAGTGGGANSGSAFGTGLFIQGNTTITLAAGAGTLTISDLIADQSGNGGSGATAGIGALSLASGTAHLTAANKFTGGISVASGATLDLGSATAAGSGTITLAGDGAALRIDSGVTIANTLAALSHLDSVTLASVTGTGLAVVGATLQVTTSGATISFGLDSSSYQTSDFTLSQNGADAVVAYTACYCRGTRILTDRGEVAVEDLTIGDRLISHSLPDGTAAHALRWIGRRSYSGRFAATNHDVLPVCIRAGALAEKLPRRDLWVSPLHALYLDGVLVPAAALVNGISIVQAQAVTQVEYFHLELDGHAVILAEGAPAESFVDDDSRGMFDNAAEHRALYPDAPRVPARYCAPRLEQGEALEALRRGIATRAGLDAAAAPALGRLTGNLEQADHSQVTGWVRDEAAPDAPVRLHILAGETLLGEVLANRFRGDLLRAGIGSGRHGFSFGMPDGLSPHSGYTIHVRRAVDGQDIPGAPQVVEPASRYAAQAAVPRVA